MLLSHEPLLEEQHASSAQQSALEGQQSVVFTCAAFSWELFFEASGAVEPNANAKRIAKSTEFFIRISLKNY